MRYPYDLRVYALAYLNFGNDAGDLEGITKYLGMYDSFRSYMEENYVSLLKQKLNLTMEGGDCDKLKRDMEFAEEFFRFKSNTLFATNLLAVQPGGQKALTGALVQIGNFFFGLLKGQFDLLLCQGHQILVDALQDEIHIRPCHGNAAGQGFFVGLGVDVVLFQEHQPDALMVEVFVQSKTFFCISGHPGHRIEHHRISCFQNSVELQPLWAKNRSSGVGFLHDMGSRVFSLDVADLTVDALLCRRDAAIAIDVHASSFWLKDNERHF